MSDRRPIRRRNRRKRYGAALTIRLAPEELARARREAARRGVSLSALGRLAMRVACGPEVASDPGEQ